MKKLILLTVLFSLSQSKLYKDEEDAFNLFQNFIKDYKKVYTSMSELMERYRIFRENLDRPLIINDEMKQGITKFFDMTTEEFKHKYLSYKPMKLSNTKNLTVQPINDPPEFWNWTREEILTNIHDQGQCGSCWAFSTCGNLEGLYNIKHPHSPFENRMGCAEQMLVDCDETNDGCDGGDMVRAAQWIKQNGGIMDRSDYLYAERKGKCKQDKSKIKIKVREVYELKSENETEMRDWVYLKGPLSVGLNAELMQFYKEGIITPNRFQKCNPENIDHGVTLVGYGGKDRPYWILRNSWGEDWGEMGNFRLQRGTGACGINKMVSTGEVE